MKKRELSAIAKKVMNEEKNGVEIYFAVYPLQGTKATLKKNGFRWNRNKNCWYAKQSFNACNIAGIMEDTTISEYENIAKSTGEAVTYIKPKETAKAKSAGKKAAKKEVTNKYGVKVGDIFFMQWGYEQTNNDFFQVVSVTACGCRVREVYLDTVNVESISSMSEYRTFDTKKTAPVEKSIFIKDQKNGDFKKISLSHIDNKPQITIKDHFANIVTDNQIEVYESSYY